jgi:hypothetical protein
LALQYFVSWYEGKNERLPSAWVVNEPRGNRAVTLSAFGTWRQPLYRRAMMRKESTPMSTQPSVAIVVPAAPPPRHALALPAGSIRAILSLLVVGLVCTLMLVPIRGQYQPIPAYLLYLLFLTLGHYFAAHGQSIHRRGEGGPSPLYLPAGSIRFVIVIGLMATVAWQCFKNYDEFEDQLKTSLAALAQQPNLPLVLMGGFLIGVIVRTIVGRDNPAYWWQDIEAWFALIAVMGLFIALLIHLVINPSLEQRLELPNFEGFLAGIVAFYFGARS